MPILNGDHISEFDTFGVNPKADNLRSVIDALRAKMTPEQIEALENASRDIDVDAVRTAYAIECERSGMFKGAFSRVEWRADDMSGWTNITGSVTDASGEAGGVTVGGEAKPRPDFAAREGH